MTYKFENDKQKSAAKLILSRTSKQPYPRKIQLSMLVISKGEYDTPLSASKFVRNFVNNPNSPVTAKGDFVVRKDLAGEA